VTRKTKNKTCVLVIVAVIIIRGLIVIAVIVIGGVGHVLCQSLSQSKSSVVHSIFALMLDKEKKRV
jgi:hypothetical protein